MNVGSAVFPLNYYAVLRIFISKYRLSSGTHRCKTSISGLTHFFKKTDKLQKKVQPQIPSYFTGGICSLYFDLNEKSLLLFLLLFRRRNQGCNCPDYCSSNDTEIRNVKYHFSDFFFLYIKAYIIGHIPFISSIHIIGKASAQNHGKTDSTHFTSMENLTPIFSQHTAKTGCRQFLTILSSHLHCPKCSIFIVTVPENQPVLQDFLLRP